VAKAFKAWHERSPGQIKRLESRGFNASSYAAATPAERRAAFGHKNTPEHPERASRNPEKYSDYLSRRDALERRVIDLKGQIFSASDKWRADRSARAARGDNPKYTIPSMANLQRFADMGADLFDEEDFDWNDDQWGFLRYH
jgi:hypothetical protein